MKGILAACAAALVFVGATAAADKIDAAKLVGKWELTKSSDDMAPKGATVEFTKDNKVMISFDLNGKELKLDGTYKVDGDKLTVKVTPPGGGKENEDTDTIKTLTDDMLVLVDKDKKENEFKKKKK